MAFIENSSIWLSDFKSTASLAHSQNKGSLNRRMAMAHLERSLFSTPIDLETVWGNNAQTTFFRTFLS